MCGSLRCDCLFAECGGHWPAIQFAPSLCGSAKHQDIASLDTHIRCGHDSGDGNSTLPASLLLHRASSRPSCGGKCWITRNQLSLSLTIKRACTS